MEAEFLEEEREHYKIPGALLKVQNDIRKLLKNEKPKTVEKCCRLVSEIGLSNGFRAEDIGTALDSPTSPPIIICTDWNAQNAWNLTVTAIN